MQTHRQCTGERSVKRRDVCIRFCVRVVDACILYIVETCVLLRSKQDGILENSFSRDLICACTSTPTTTCQPGQRASVIGSLTR
jgi:hypothetical protein